jgi:ribose-phosphate pyrophosphokinase
VAPIIKNNNNLDDTVIIAPDAGAVKSAQILSKILNVPLAVCIKDRILQRCDLIGHVHACHCVIVDDVVLSGTTLRLCFDTLKSHGAKDISIAIPHLPYTYDWFKDFKMIITTNSCQKLPFSDTCVFIDLKEILNQCLMS